MRHLVSPTVVCLVLLSAAGCGPAHNVRFLAVDARSGNPISGAHARQTVQLVSFPTSLLLLPGGVAPLTDERVTDENGEVQFANSRDCTYRLRASGYKDAEIGQLWLKLRSVGATHVVGLPSEEATIYKVTMQPLQE